MLEERRILESLPTTSKPFLKEMSSIVNAANIFKEFDRKEVVPILDEAGCPLGVITRSRLFESLVDGFSPETTVSEIMESNLRTVRMDSLLEEMFSEEQEQNYIIIDSNGKFVSLFPPKGSLKGLKAKSEKKIIVEALKMANGNRESCTTSWDPKIRAIPKIEEI